MLVKYHFSEWIEIKQISKTSVERERVWEFFQRRDDHVGGMITSVKVD